MKVKSGELQGVDRARSSRGFVKSVDSITGRASILPLEPIIVANGRLPVRCSPEHGESPLGFALRESLACGYPHPAWLSNRPDICTYRWARLYRANDTYSLLQDIGLPAAEAKQLSGTDTGRPQKFTLGINAPLHVTLRNREHPKICTVCLVDAPFLQASWELRLWTACPIHGCMMTGSCPDCGGQHDWKRQRLDGGCRPSSKRTIWGMPTADVGVIDFVRCIARATGIKAPAPSIRLSELLAGLDVSRLSRLAHRLSVIDRWDGAANLTLDGKWQPDLSEAVSAVAVVGRFLQGWPETLHKVVEKAWSASMSRDNTTEPTRELFQKLMMTALAGKQFTFIRGEFSIYYKRRFEPMLPRISRKPAGDDSVCIRTAGKMLGLKNRVLNKQVAISKIRAHTIALRGRNVLMIERDEVAKVSRRERLYLPFRAACIEAGALTRTEAANLLGINRNRIELLTASGLIGAKDVSVHCISHYSRAVINTLLARLNTTAHAKTVTDGRDHTAGSLDLSNLVALTEISGRFSISDLLEAVERLGIAPDAFFDQEVGLRRFCYGTEKVASIRLAAARGFFTQKLASLELGCSVTSVWTLVSAGVLEKVSNTDFTGKSGSGTPWMISAASIAFVSSRLVSTSGLARTVKMYTNRLKSLLDTLDLQPDYALGTAETTLWSYDKIIPALHGAGFSLTKD